MADKNGLLLDNLFDVLVFVRVSETGNFTSAAEKLQISRSAAGKCLQRLENRVSTRLLHRTTRRLRLTDEGERFICTLNGYYPRWMMRKMHYMKADKNLPAHCGLLSQWSLAAIM